MMPYEPYSEREEGCACISSKGA
uniref:Uncharacterized protein n=1 Tax=Arundo donax TaxID=35708 RepID=A0A0A8YAN8_ARUDO